MPTSPRIEDASRTQAEASMSWARAHRLAGTLPAALGAERVALTETHGRTLADTFE